MSRTVIQLSLALLIVGAAVANPLGLAFLDDNGPTQEAEASIAPGGCALPMFLLGQCESADNATAENLQDHMEIYQHVVSVRSATRSFFAMTENYLTDTQDVAWIKAEQAVFNAAMNGSDEAVATLDTKDAIRDYYTTIQRNAYDNWNTQVASLNSTYSQADNLSGANPFYISSHIVSPGLNNAVLGDTTISGFQSKTIQLINGSEMEVRQYQLNVQISGEDSIGDYHSFSDTFWVGPQTHLVHEHTWNRFDSVVEFSEVRLKPPTSEYPHAYAIWTEGWQNFNQKLYQNKDETIAKADNFTTATYADLQAGNINVSDALSRVTKMNNFVVQSTDSTAGFNELVAGLVGSGMTVPEGLESGYMNITFTPLNSPNTDITKDGLLLSSSSPPNGTWEVGVTYNASDISGGELIVGLDGTQTSVNQTSGTITINGAYSADGSELQTTTFDAPDRDYRTANTSELQDRIVSLTSKINDLEQRLDSGSSGGGGFSLSVPSIGLDGIDNQWLWLGAGVVVVVLFSRG